MRVEDVLAAIADPTRRGILDCLRRGEASAGELGRPFAISQPAMSRHLRTLEGARLIERRRIGTRHIFRLTPHRLAEIDAWLEPFRAAMEANYARLDDLLAENPDPEPDP